MTVVDELEQFHEKSIPNVSLLILCAIEVDILRDQSFTDVLGVREVDSSEKAVAVERPHRQGITIKNIFLAKSDVHRVGEVG